MGTALHITNGDSTAERMQQGGITGNILPWRDVLHDGPVPVCDDQITLSEIRARFISGRGWADYDRCLQSFVDRDTTLSNCAQYDKVCLWFEHDLYDQLQILQILDFLNRGNTIHNHVEMICVDRYLGLMDPAEIAGLDGQAAPVTAAQYALASIAWLAFNQSEPENWSGLLQRDLSPLPFLQGAVHRMLEEYPAVGSGITRTERQALAYLADQPASPLTLFTHNQSCEERIYLGDSSYWIILRELMMGDRPLIQFMSGAQEITEANKPEAMQLTEFGQAVLAGNLDRMTAHFPDRWIGGVHLNSETKWRWDASNSRILRL